MDVTAMTETILRAAMRARMRSWTRSVTTTTSTKELIRRQCEADSASIQMMSASRWGHWA
eukprot:4772321-Alexandrium_andersonii.AAC.1